MELDDASIASFATARVYKVISLLSNDSEREKERERERENEWEEEYLGLRLRDRADDDASLSDLTPSLSHPAPPPPHRTHTTTPPPPFQSDPPSRINSLCFHRTDPLLFAASDEDHSLRVIDSSTGDLRATVPCPKHGVSLVVATHAPTAVLHASNKASEPLSGAKESGDGSNMAIYLDLHSNAHLRYFRGHASRLCALSLSPSDDTFVSAAVDGTVRFWDLRSPVATGAIDLPPTRRVPVGGIGGVCGIGGRRGELLPPPLQLLPAAAPAVAHEEQGMVMAISAGAGAPLRLFDARAIGRGPFAALPEAAELPPLAAPRPAHAAAQVGPPLLVSPDPDRLVFSPDGGAIAVAGGGGLLVLDSFKGSVIARLLPGAPPPPTQADGDDPSSSSPSPSASAAASASALTPTWTPCGRYIVSGCSDGAIRAWKVRGRGGGGAAGAGRGPVTPAPAATWLGHAEAPGALAWAPRTQMAASGDASALALWVPGPGRSLLEGK